MAARPPVPSPIQQQEFEAARALATRYRCDFVDLKETPIDHDLFQDVPVDLMFRYNFVPLAAHNGTLEIALSDPRNLNLIDELSLLQFPVVLGSGRRLFGPGTQPAAMKLMQSRSTEKGLVISTYRRDGALRTGAIEPNP